MGLKDIHTLDYTVLLCSKMRETRVFYEDVMGFAIEYDSESWVSFRVGATLLALRPRGQGPAWQDGGRLEGTAAVQLAFRVPPQSIETCYAELLAKGVPIVRGPTDIPAWRHRTVFFRDPEDNVIEIYAEY